MELISFNVPDEHIIYFLGDTHKGVVCHHEEGFNEVIEKIRNKKNVSVVFMGDLVEGRPLGHRFFDLDVADPKMLLPENQYEAFKESIKPIKDKIITILEGKHDRDISRLYGNKVKTLCKELNIHFGTFSSIITFRDQTKSQKQLYKIYCTHGSGTIRSSAGDIIRREANMKESLKRKLKNMAADCLAMFQAHTHLLMVAEPKQRLYMISDDRKIQQIYSKRHGRSTIIPEDDRWYGNTGSFMKSQIKGITTYAEIAMYDPIEMGYLKLIGKGDNIVDIIPVPI